MRVRLGIRSIAGGPFYGDNGVPAGQTCLQMLEQLCLNAGSRFAVVSSGAAHGFGAKALYSFSQ
jgi:hypothetical protein